MSGNPDYCEYREIRFVTDSFGFQNEPLDPDMPSGPLDIVILGDSFGAGFGTTQEETWGSILERDYRLNVYNLSIVGCPSDEYINLALEIDRLNTDEETVVLWCIFTGNDLDDNGYFSQETTQPPWKARFNSVAVPLQSFMSHSPVYRLLTRINRKPGNQVLVTDFQEGRKEGSFLWSLCTTCRSFTRTDPPASILRVHEVGHNGRK